MQLCFIAEVPKTMLGEGPPAVDCKYNCFGFKFRNFIKRLSNIMPSSSEKILVSQMIHSGSIHCIRSKNNEK